ncbi:hypothetical protein M569_14826 [Genlisea aurea]|uniref:BTB domain-containing protein n=1 Tax=Genlisea aurea TaxID=192259 RepID=S8DB94_9LAMI|nr:hypothetical protein M569_14826 [Genlisea aurea]
MDPFAFKVLLHFIYCDKLSGEISDDEYRSLSDAADTYGFTRLKGDLRSPIKKSNKLCNLPYVTKSHIYEEQSD